MSEKPQPRIPLAEKLQWDIEDVTLATGMGARTIWRMSDRNEFPKPYTCRGIRRKFWSPDAVRGWVRQEAEKGGAA